MADLDQYAVTNLTKGNIQQAHRFRIEGRWIDNSDPGNPVVLGDFTESAGESILYAFKTNIAGELTPDERDEIKQNIEDILVRAKARELGVEV